MNSKLFFVVLYFDILESFNSLLNQNKLVLYIIINYIKENNVICKLINCKIITFTETVIGHFITIHVTVSEQEGVVNDPSYV